MNAKGEGGWDELGDYDEHIYTTDAVYKMGNS